MSSRSSRTPYWPGEETLGNDADSRRSPRRLRDRDEPALPGPTMNPAADVTLVFETANYKPDRRIPFDRMRVLVGRWRRSRRSLGIPLWRFPISFLFFAAYCMVISHGYARAVRGTPIRKGESRLPKSFRASFGVARDSDTPGSL
jgi:hypothetical protein